MGAGSGVEVEIGAAVGMRTGASWGAGGAGDRGLGADAGAGVETEETDETEETEEITGGRVADEAGGEGRDRGGV